MNNNNNNNFNSFRANGYQGGPPVDSVDNSNNNSNNNYNHFPANGYQGDPPPAVNSVSTGQATFYSTGGGGWQAATQQPSVANFHGRGFNQFQLQQPALQSTAQQQPQVSMQQALKSNTQLGFGNLQAQQQQRPPASVAPNIQVGNNQNQQPTTHSSFKTSGGSGEHKRGFVSVDSVHLASKRQRTLHEQSQNTRGQLESTNSPTPEASKWIRASDEMIKGRRIVKPRKRPTAKSPTQQSSSGKAPALLRNKPSQELFSSTTEVPFNDTKILATLTSSNGDTKTPTTSTPSHSNAAVSAFKPVQASFQAAQSPFERELSSHGARKLLEDNNRGYAQLEQDSAVYTRTKQEEKELDSQLKDVDYDLKQARLQVGHLEAQKTELMAAKKKKGEEAAGLKQEIHFKRLQLQGMDCRVDSSFVGVTAPVRKEEAALLKIRASDTTEITDVGSLLVDRRTPAQKMMQDLRQSAATCRAAFLANPLKSFCTSMGISSSAVMNKHEVPTETVDIVTAILSTW